MIFKINQKEYKIRPGFSITDNYNETLDSANIVISHVKDEIDIEPFDECEIISNTPIKGFELETDDRYHYYMAVDGYQKVQLSVESNPYYEYQISLFSQTKYLEGIILPSLKITRGETPRKIYSPDDIEWGYLDEYLKEYGAKVRYKTLPSGKLALKPKWEFSHRVKYRFSQIDCPEMQWNNPTLRQVLTDLMMVDDCIPVLRNNVIDYIDISKEKKQASKLGVNFIRESQSSSDYISELRMDIKNAIQDKKDETYVTISEYVSFRNNSVGLLTDQNIRIDTTYPIYELTSLKMNFWIEGYASEYNNPKNKAYINTLVETDLVENKMCVEKGLYDVKDIWFSKSKNDPIPKTFKETSKYQNFNVYYNRGGRTIEGWNVLTDKDYLIESKTRAFDVIIDTIANENSVNATQQKVNTYTYKENGEIKEFKTNDAGLQTNHELWNKYFKVTYRTTADALFQASRGNKPRNNRIVVDNQSSSFVDAKAQGMLEYMKANRLGNKMKLINARYELGEYENIAELGELFDSSVVFKRDMSFFDDYVMVNYYATKDYILRDYFTGVKAKQRSWKLLDGSEALVRHDLYKVYLELDFKKTKEIDKPLLNVISNYGLDLFTNNGFSHNMRYCAMQFYTKNGIYPDNMGLSVNYLQSELVKRIVGNSIVFNAGVNDNIYFAKYLAGTTAGGIAQNPYPYADENGENDGFNFVLTNRINPMDYRIGDWDDLVRYDYVNNKDAAGITQDKMLKATAKKPAVAQNQIDFDNSISFDYNIKKDNSEITKFTFQIEYCTSTNKIVIGKKFIEYQSIYSSKTPVSISVYESNQLPSSKNAEYLPTDVTLTKGKIAVTNNELKVTGTFTKDAIYITDEKKNVIIAFDRRASQNNTLYLNFLLDRDKSVSGGSDIYINN